MKVNAQEFRFKLTKDGFDEKLESGTEVSVKKEKKLFIQETSDNGNTFFLHLKDGIDLEFTSGKEFKEFDLKDFDATIKPVILDKDKVPIFDFVFKDDTGNGNSDDANDSNGGDDDDRNLPSETAQDIVETLFRIEAKPYGLIVKSGDSKYLGEKYIHIFLDQYGSLINSTIPQGVSEKQYVVHIIYIAPQKNRQIFYSIRENKSSFNPALRFNNEDFRKLASSLSVAISKKNESKFEWYQQEILLSTSTTDIEFELYLILVNKTNYYNFEKKSLSKYTIKMTPTLHGTFDIGLIYSSLENPEFDIVTSPTDPAEKVVKRTEVGKRGVITAMATFYTSPVLLIEKYFMGKQIPNYKLSGRNFLDDHEWYERIYPTIGVGFTDKTFENLFYGFNWEFARGGSVFFGWHLGKVNYLNVGNNFVYEETTITEGDFNLKKNRKWATSTAIGLKLDVKLVLGLFGQGNNSQQ